MVGGRHKQRQGVWKNLGAHRKLPHQLTIHLHIHRFAGRTMSCDRMAMKNGTALDVFHALQRYSKKIRQVLHRECPPEEHNFEIIAKQRGALSNLEIAAVVPNAADHSDARLVNSAVDRHFNLRHRTQHLGEAANIVSEFSRRSFEIEIQSGDDICIQTDTGHTKEGAGFATSKAQTADGNALRLELAETQRRALDAHW